MKLKFFVTALVLSTIAGGVFAAEAEKAPIAESEKLGYSLGAMFGSRMKEMHDNLDAEWVAKGIHDALSGQKLALNQSDMEEQIQKAQRAAAEKMQKQMLEMGQKNLEKANEFLKENGKKSDIVTTKSGLQYKVLTAGKGIKPSETNEVTVHYEGKLLDGTVFDSSYPQGQPATFRLNRVISGWTEALQMMPEGSTWELYIPSDLAYGQNGAPQGGIGPNSLLVFKVELINVNASEKKD